MPAGLACGGAAASRRHVAVVRLLVAAVTAGAVAAAVALADGGEQAGSPAGRFPVPAFGDPQARSRLVVALRPGSQGRHEGGSLIRSGARVARLTRRCRARSDHLRSSLAGRAFRAA